MASADALGGDSPRLEFARQVLDAESRAIASIMPLLDATFDRAVELVLHAGDGDQTLSSTIAAASQGVFEDLVGEMGVTGKGALEVRSDQALSLAGRVYNRADNGTFGQFFDGYTYED